MDSNLVDFVKKAIGDISKFDSTNSECITKVVRRAIDFYRLKSFEEVEENNLGTIRFLHIHSIVEENLLSKIVEISTNNERDITIESLYDGRVIRGY